MTAVEERTGASVSSTAPSTWLVWTALGIVYVVWGSTYLAIKIAIETLPSFTMAGVRFLVAGLILLTVLAVASPGSFRMTRSQLLTGVLVGLLLPLGGNGLVVVAEEGINSGLAALLVAAVPLWIVVLRWLGRDRPTWLTVLGVVIGFAGVAVLLLGGGEGGKSQLGSALLVILASLSWAVGSYLSTRRPMPASPFMGTAIEMVAGGIGLLIAGTARGELGGFALSAVSARSWLAMAYLIVFGSLIAFTAYVWVLGVAPVSTVTTYAYVNPAVAVMLGALILGEPVTTGVIVGGGIILAAVAVVVTEEGRRARNVRRSPSG